MAEEPSSSHPSLTVLGGSMAGTQFVLDQAVDNVLIGSDASCRFCLSVSGVSPVHARIWVDENGITLYSAHSSKELYVNDDVVSDHVTLNNGDVIWLGSPGDEQSVMIQVRIPPRDAREAEPAPQRSTKVEDSQTMALPREDITASLRKQPPPTTPIPDESTPPPPEFEEDLGDQSETATATPPPPTTPVPETAPPPQPPTATPVPETTPIPQPPRVTPIPRTTPIPQPPAPPAARPAVHPTAAPPHRPVPRHPLARSPKRASTRSSGKLIAVAIVLLAVVGGGGFAAWFFVLRPRGVLVPTSSMPPARPSAPPIASPVPTPAEDFGVPPVDASPTPEIGEETPEPIEVVTIVNTPTPPRDTPTPAKTPKPASTPSQADVQSKRRAAEIEDLMNRARQSASAGRYQEAASLYGRVLRLDPDNSSAANGKATADDAASSLSRRFVPGRTSVVAKSGRADLSGFDTGDVRVAKAPDYSGLIDFQVAPNRVKPGDSYSIKVTLTNDGRKNYRLATASLTITQNGDKSGGSTRVPSREIRTKRSITLAEHAGTWERNVKSWRMDVKVTTTHGDEFSCTLSWR